MMGRVYRIQFVIYISVYLVSFTSKLFLWIPITEGKISDACHGYSSFNQTINMLDCESGSQICITEVRYYLEDPQDGCPKETTDTSVSPECCLHNASRCSWVMTTTDKVKELQPMCSNKARCELHSNASKTMAEPCLNITSSTMSNVRSITYICSSTGSCPTISPGVSSAAPVTSLTDGKTKDDNHTTGFPKSSEHGEPAMTTSKKTTPRTGLIATSLHTTLSVTTTQAPNKTKPQKDTKQEKNVTGAIVGGVLGGLVLIGIAVVIFIVLRRRPAKDTPPRVDHPASDDVTPRVIRPSPGYDSVNTRYSFYQPDRAGIGEALEDNGEAGAPLDRYDAVHLSALYSKVNKNRESEDNTSGPEFSVQTTLQNGHTEYDQVQGESAHFRVHGDYDHVAGFSDVDESANVIARHGMDNPGIDMTYDHLHRGQAVTRSPQAEANPYDVLKRETTTAV